MNAQPNVDFRWLSPLGLSVALLLGFGLLHVLAALAVPIVSRATGNTGGMTQTQVELLMVGVMTFGLTQLGVVWFGLRAGHIWGLWLVAAMDLAQFVVWIAYGSRTGDWGAPSFFGMTQSFSSRLSCSAGSACGDSFGRTMSTFASLI